MNLEKFLLLIGLLFPVFIFGQGESNNWYFGENAGITFSADGTTVTPLTDGQVNTIEGCATVSNAQGNLLFYTDGVTVYDQNHNVMPNGTGLYGQVSSSQSAVIVPWPQNDDLYLIFTANHRDPGFSYPNQGLHYSVVDITLNGGNGDVTTKNTMLRNATAEKIAAVVKDCTTESMWIVTLGTDDSPLLQPSRRNNLNTYHAFEVTTAGVNPTSVQSPSPNISIDRDGAEGYLKFSPDGFKMASANMDRGLFIYDFDTTTGIISNEQQLFLGGSNLHPYGVEFSPNSRYLYTHSSSARPIFRNSSLFQFDLQAADISNSRFNLDPVHETFDLTRGGLQLGPDGKIYRALQQGFNIAGQALGTNYLGVINNPDIGGAGANYVHNGVNLNGRESFQGLPPLVPAFFDKTDLTPNKTSNVGPTYEVCEGEALLLEIKYFIGATYVWEINGAVIPGVNTNVLDIPAAAMTDDGDYVVTITLPNAAQCPIDAQLEIIVNPSPATTSDTLVTCDVDADPTNGITAIDLTQLEDTANFSYWYYASILDRDGDTPIIDPTNFTNTIAFDQTIYYKATSNTNGCENLGEFAVQIRNAPAFTIDTQWLCSGGPDITVVGPTGFDSYRWIKLEGTNEQEVSTSPDAILTEIGNYRLDAGIDFTAGTDVFSCVSSANFSVQVPTARPVEISPNQTPVTSGIFTVCENLQLVLETDNFPNGVYTWEKDGVAISNPGNHVLQIANATQADAGNYTVTITGPGDLACPITAEMEIVVDPIPVANIIEILKCDSDSDNFEDGITSFNLTQIEPNSGIDYFYYESIGDRDTDNPITSPEQYRNTTAFNQTIYIKTVNTSGCENYAEVELQVRNAAPIVMDTRYWLCPENPTVTLSAPNGYDSYEWYRIITGTPQSVSTDQAFTTTDVGEYLLEASNEFANTSETIACTNSVTIEVLASSLNTVDLIPNGTPAENEYTVCEGQQLLLETQEITGATYVWEKDNTPIASSNNHILQIDVITGLDAGDYSVSVTPPDALTCPITSTLTILVDPALVVSNFAIITCDSDIEDRNDGITTLDLRQVEDNPALVYTFYESSADRDADNFISNPENYRNTVAFDQTIYVKATNSLGCEAFAELQVEVRNAPEIVLDESYWICSASPTVSLEGPVGFDTYQWFRLNGTSEELISTDQNITISDTGEYLMEAGMYYSNNTETVNCTNIFPFSVLNSTTPEITDIVVDGENNVNTVEILLSIESSFEFSLDGISYQDANIFENVPPGSTTVYVRDKNGCAEIDETIEIEADLDGFGFPKFFTPNGDGINDFWQYIPPPVEALSLDVEMISIFNRYGDLIVQIRPNSYGWDGNFQGTPLPSSDYWFRARIAGNSEITGHFSLKR